MNRLTSNNLSGLPADIHRLLLADPAVFNRLIKVDQRFRRYLNDPSVLSTLCNATLSRSEIKRVFLTIINPDTYLQFSTEPSLNYDTGEIYSYVNFDDKLNYVLSFASSEGEYDSMGLDAGDFFNTVYDEYEMVNPEIRIVYLAYKNRDICVARYPNYAIDKTLEFYDQQISKWMDLFNQYPNKHSELRSLLNSYLSLLVINIFNTDEDNILDSSGVTVEPGLSEEELDQRLFLGTRVIRELLPTALLRYR